ncbi:hypothetical protein MLD38_034913 [Melastoma candidum]|uniref:Uncharacterized protein n=1 Tax=Melastoma candidum TaxID=119954 RepID=A0ACB9MF93_9MYRT|nr:hypothetical protein MLD38_034913 [Melastoma candidum]
MPSRNVVSWTSVISGYSRNCQYRDALWTFLQMEGAVVEQNEMTVASVLPACAKLGVLATGERIVKYSREKGFVHNLYVNNAVLEMYTRCGMRTRQGGCLTRLVAGGSHVTWPQ